MHAPRSPSSIPTFVSKDALDLSLTGSQLLVTKRPSSASPGKCFSRSVSVSVAGDGRGKRNTLSDVSFGSSRSVKNLRRSNSTTHVNLQANVSLSLSQDQDEDYLALFDSSEDGRKKLAGLSKTSPDRTTWNILDDQPRVCPLQSSPRSAASVDSPSFLKRRDFTANNRSNKAAVGNSVTTILHNNYSEKPLTPKSSNQKPSFNNLLKANDEVQLENGSVTKSQKNFSSPTSTSNNKCLSPVSLSSPVLSTRREVTEEEAERFIQQVNQAAITIQRWYRQHIGKRRTNQAALQQILTSKRKEWEERTEEEHRVEQRQKRDEERRRIREEKARLARLVAIQELQQKRPSLVSEVQTAADVELENQAHPIAVGQRRPPRVSLSNRSLAASPNNNSPVSPTVKAKNTEFNLNLVSDLGELSFRAISPALSHRRGSQGSQELEDRKEEHICVELQENDQKLICKEKVFMVSQDMQQKKGQHVTDAAEEVVERLRPAGAAVHKKPPRFSPNKRITNTGSKKSLKSPSAVKTKNTDSNRNLVADVSELSFRAISPASPNHRGSHCSQEALQRSLSMEDQRAGTSSKTTLNDLLDTLRLLEEEPEQLCQPKVQQKEKYAWIDEDGDSNSLTTDNLELHGQMSLHPALPDGGALLSEAKLQSIMSFLDEMEKSEQERPRSVTSGSHREGVLSEEELPGVEHASATAAEISTSMMRLKMEVEEKKRTVNMLQAALAQQRELTMRHVKDTEKELNRNFKLQKDQYEATVQRHLTFIDQLISDKKTLSERCEEVVAELKHVDQKYTKKIAQMQEQHDMEIKKLKDLMSATEKMRREKWIDEKTKKIKEITVKGLEPEIQKLISKHKTELKKLRTLHEAELLQADDRAAQRFVRQCEELRAQLEREKDEQCQRERELAKQRYDKQFQEEELSLQQQRRRLYQEVAEEKERLVQLAARQRAELEDLRRHMEENSSLAARALREELDKTREEQEKRHQMEMKSLLERLDVEKQTWEENYRKKEEAWLLSRERELKDELRRERDKEIEMAIRALEEETSKDKEECERTADNRVKRLREKYDAEMKELERSERAAVEKQQELRKQQMETEEELISLQSNLRQKQQDAEELTQTRDKLMEERRTLAEVIRQEFADRLVMTEEENRKIKAEMSEVRARLRLEVEKVTKEKEEELAEVHQRVKSAILKKEEMVSNLRKQYEAALKRADHLEALWDQQRKQLLGK